MKRKIISVMENDTTCVIGSSSSSSSSSSGSSKSIEMCSVCLEAITQTRRNICKLKSCNHTFHSECLQTWLLSNETCPVCRGDAHCNHGGLNNHSKSIIIKVMNFAKREMDTLKKDITNKENENAALAMMLRDVITASRSSLNDTVYYSHENMSPTLVESLRATMTPIFGNIITNISPRAVVEIAQRTGLLELMTNVIERD